MRNINRLGLIILVVAVCAAVSSEAVEIARLDKLQPGDLGASGFELTKDASVTIDAVGMRPRDADQLSVYAWILNTDTRELVWIMQPGATDRVRGSRQLRQVNETESLRAGKYELYMYAGRHWNWGDNSINLKNLFTEIFSGEWDEEDIEELRECHVTISADGLSAGQVKSFTPDGGFPDALIRHTKLRDSEYLQTAFRLNRDMNIRIYALIEFPSGYREPVDQAWIINNSTRERVWEISRWDADYAGGGRKNQVYDDEISLPKGEYTLYAVTDDSHSYEEFNTAPPYDPINWGVTLLPGRNSDRTSFAVIDLPESQKPIIDFTRARDNDFFEQPFRVSKTTDVHVYAIGECGSDKQFVDYGAIQEAGTGRVVWEMDYRNTTHAGGAEKNRMFDGTITLEPGLYYAFYSTDDSHAFDDWNASAPYDARSYGLALYPSREGTASAITLVTTDEVSEQSNVLARLTRVRDGERLRQRFTLNKDSWVHIYAVGEGTGGRMYDYAYIIDNSTGRDVWEMTWRKTDHAGGASKNRRVDDTILLPKGEYEVIYVTDDSHSFNNWNSAPPRDPMNWGVTITLSDKR